MMTIPFNPRISSRQSFSVHLGKALARMSLYWDERSSVWHMSIKGGSGDAVEGVTVVPDWPLLRQYRYKGVVDGDIIVHSTQGAETITYDGLGSDFVIYYLTRDEVSAWERAHGMD